MATRAKLARQCVLGLQRADESRTGLSTAPGAARSEPREFCSSCSTLSALAAPVCRPLGGATIQALAKQEWGRDGFRGDGCAAHDLERAEDCSIGIEQICRYSLGDRSALQVESCAAVGMGLQRGREHRYQFVLERVHCKLDLGQVGQQKAQRFWLWLCAGGERAKQLKQIVR